LNFWREMDTEDLLRLLKEHKVDFVIIGATAMPVYGYVRATLDIDIFIRPERLNAQRTAEGWGLKSCYLSRQRSPLYHCFFIRLMG